jgi:hypothetical protein
MEVDLYCTGDALGRRSGRHVSTRKETWKVGAREGAGALHLSLAAPPSPRVGAEHQILDLVLHSSKTHTRL